MTDKHVSQVPSETALFAALHRTIARKVYNEKFGPDSLAEIFLPPHYRFFMKFEKVRQNTKNKLSALMPGVTEYICARTAFFDELFLDGLNKQIPQIVLLGAGYDSRPYRFARHNQGTQIFELDAAPTQQRKIKCLKAAHIRIPPEVRYVPINFLVESLGDVLTKAGCNPQAKTLFIWEGVSYYLDREAVKATLGFVSGSHRDSLIAFDYTISLSAENTPAYYGADVFMQSMKQHHKNEALMFSVKTGGMETFLAEMGLRVVEHLDNEAIEHKYLLDDSGSLIGRMTGNFWFVSAAPIK